MKPNRASVRFFPVATLLGVLTLSAGTALHPMGADPNDAAAAFGVLPGTGSNASMERTPDGKCGRPRTAEKPLAFHSKESMCVSAGGRRRRLQNLRPGEYADPGLVSVRTRMGRALRHRGLKS
jgi:hypothetical protein